MRPEKLIDWEYLRDHYIAPGTPIEELIIDDPELRLFFQPIPTRLGIRLELRSDQQLPRVGELKNITVDKVQALGRTYAQVMTDVRELFPSIYALIGDVLRRVAEGQNDCLVALAQSLKDFEALVAKAWGMSHEEAIGLYGELWVLEELVNAGKVDAKAWIGANRQNHDIRFWGSEFEVKATTANHRHHFIHGLNQLNPSPNRELFLISVRLGIAGNGGGRSLDQLISALQAIFAKSDDDAQYFNEQLEKLSYVVGQPEGRVTYQIAGAPMKISVGADLPVVNAASLSQLVGEALTGRVMKLDLLLNLEGMGKEFIASDVPTGQRW